MQSKIYFVFGQLIVFCNLLTCCKALVGQGVRQAALHEFPYVVSLSLIQGGSGSSSSSGASSSSGSSYRNRQFLHFCGGALISPRDILTAEHCVTGKEPESITAVIGTNDIRKGKKFRVLCWWTYTDWATIFSVKLEYRNNDIAIVRLYDNITHVEPAKISPVRIRRLVGQTVYLAGWGRKEDGNGPKNMDAAELQALDHTECTSKIFSVKNESYYLESSFICTIASPPILIREGDDGGPLMHWNQIVGVTITVAPFPEKPSHPNRVNLHLGVYNYRHFIFNIIGAPDE